MKHLRILTLTGLLFFSLQQPTQAQEESVKKESMKMYAGIGLGMDYGGIGLKMEFQPIPYLGIFAGVGYNFKGLGFNGGLSYKILPHKRLTPTIQAMYGYNGVLIVNNATGLDKESYGPSVGAGVELRVGKRTNKFFLAVYYPFRSNEFKEHIDYLKTRYPISFENELLPVTFSFGFHFNP